MESSSYDAGFPLVALLTGLGWYAALCARCGLPQAAARALRWGLAAVPIQLACLVVASIVLLAGAPRAGRFLLDQAWIPVAVAGIAIARRTRGSAR